MSVEKERAAFEQIMRVNTARLMDFSRPYVSRLSNKDREGFLAGALVLMWDRRKTHNPKTESLLQYWDRCLKAMAMTKRSWLVSRFDGWVWVRGDKLGQEE